MNSVKPLAARFYRLKSGHAPVSTYLKRFGHRDDDKCWWCGGGSQCSQPSRPSEISPGRTDGAKAVLLRPSSRRTECRPLSTVIERLLYIFRLNLIKPDNVIQGSECMKSWCRGHNLWRNRVRNSMDGADAHRSCITVRIVIEMIFL